MLSPIRLFEPQLRTLLHFRLLRPAAVGALLVGCLLAAQPASEAAPPPEFRTLQGNWIELVTDLPQSPGTASLPASFDAAVPQWLEYWDVDLAQLGDWRLKVYLMADPAAFRRRGLLPAELPDFRHGYAQGRTAWVVAQGSDYYSRHLVLHEGLHSLAFELFGGAGPFWFMEGTAELLATHHGVGENLRLPVVPPNREATPLWGRLKLIGQRRSAGRLPSIQSVMRFPNRLSNDVEPYAWSWAAAMFLHMYPEYRGELRALAPQGQDTSAEFTRTLYRRLYDDWPVLRARWRIFLDQFDYGFDLIRNRVELDRAAPLWDPRQGHAKPLQVTIAADRGWQTSGVRLPAGSRLQLTAAGRYLLGRQPAPWVCEPQGVTVRYHRGRPLGRLLATLVPTDPAATSAIAPLAIESIGRQGRVEVDEESWLLLQVGDVPSEWADNEGEVTVQIRHE